MNNTGAKADDSSGVGLVAHIAKSLDVAAPPPVSVTVSPHGTSITAVGDDGVHRVWVLSWRDLAALVAERGQRVSDDVLRAARQIAGEKP